MRQQKFQNIHQLFEISSGRLQGFYEKNTSGRRGKASQYLKQLGVPHRRVSVEYHFGDKPLLLKFIRTVGLNLTAGFD